MTRSARIEYLNCLSLKQWECIEPVSSRVRWCGHSGTYRSWKFIFTIQSDDLHQRQFDGDRLEVGDPSSLLVHYIYVLCSLTSPSKSPMAEMSTSAPKFEIRVSYMVDVGDLLAYIYTINANSRCARQCWSLCAALASMMLFSCANSLFLTAAPACSSNCTHLTATV